MVATRSGRFNRPITSNEQKLYDHLLYWIEWETPEEMLERFRALFIDGVGYPDVDTLQALKSVVATDLASEDFRYVLNRCCHILINRWQPRPQAHAAILALIQLFNEPPSTRVVSPAHSRYVRRLRQLIQLFTETEQYHNLLRFAQVLTEAGGAASAENLPLGTLIRRYPYLYEHCLLSEDSSLEQQHTVREVQASMQRQFEVQLSQYVTYQVRRSQTQIQPAPVSNPTLLNDRELGSAIKHYIGRVEGNRTHRDIALNFQTHISHSASFRSFKDDLYQYITAGVDPEYGKRKFNNQLYQQLQNTLPESNGRSFNDFLMVRTCTQLLNFLVADNPQYPNHFVFVDLITNLGPVLTIGLLLKIVLLCRKVKPCLEKRFSILFSHYEAHNSDGVHWLVQALENLNVALSTNFGSVNLSFLR